VVCFNRALQKGAESAGINRHGAEDERAPHKRRSCSIMAGVQRILASREGVASCNMASCMMFVVNANLRPGEN
jgi:hypothetical protein